MIDPADLRDAFDRAASLPPQERAAFLARIGGTSDALRREVERLLAADARVGSTFDTEPGSDPASGSIASGATSLQPGTRLGPFEVVAPLGVGGMGEVYKARDTRLDRIVAIKVLSHDLIADSSARQRLDREARAVAALSHPHICPLFDVGHQDGIDFLVMEFLDGETLASRLRRGKLTLGEALTYAGQIADALAAAHRAGIVHRDLKPGNIMVTSSGVKLLDFGLAKRRQPQVASDVTMPTAEPLTHAGMILGTVQYMAPEQLEGQPADERTDVFAFGVVVYEMFTGQQAFDGRSTAAIIGKILHADPPRPSSIDRHIPRALDALIRECLAKDPNSRRQSIPDVQRQLSATVINTRSTKRGLVWFGGATLTLAGLTALTWSLSTLDDRAARPSASGTAAPDQGWLDQDIYAMQVGGGARALLTSPFLDAQPQYSPDGRQIAFSSARSAGVPEIWVAASDGTGARQLTHGPGRHQSEPHWSPDGRSIAFESLTDKGDWHIWTIPANGGVPRQLTFQPGHNIVPSWSRDGRWIYFSANNAGRDIWRVAATGGEPHRVTEGGSGSMACESIDGNTILYKKDETNGPLFAVPIKGGRSQQVVPCVRGGRGFAAGPQGIYYVACEAEANPSIRVRDWRTGSERAVAAPPDSEPSDRDFAISGDGRTILYSKMVVPSLKAQ